MKPLYDVIIVGGGPAGLQAALTLGRGRKRVLLCDAGPPRNAAALHVQNFVTRDGTSPSEFRRIAREQLAAYPNVQTTTSRVQGINGSIGTFHVEVETGKVMARRVLLCTGMVDDLPAIDGFRALWGSAIFACPYCHGWEVQDRRFGCLATSSEMLTFAIFLRGWTSDVVALTNGPLEISDDLRTQLASANVRIEPRRIRRLVPDGHHLRRVEFEDGEPLDRDVLVAHPPQRQVDLVCALGLELDDKGFVRVNDMRETSVPGIYAAGDLTSQAQSAVLGAAAGMHAAATMNRGLTLELATTATSAIVQ